jgi:hypothetical protein
VRGKGINFYARQNSAIPNGKWYKEVKFCLNGWAMTMVVSQPAHNAECVPFAKSAANR